MSYILDALRRADAERSRGAVPGLHAQNIPADGEPAARNFNPLIWAAGAAGALLVAVVVVLVFAPWREQASVAAPDARLAPAPELAPVAREGPPAPAPLAQGELPPPQPGGIDPGARPIEPPMGRGNPPPLADARPPQAYPPAQQQRPPAREPQADRVAAGRVATLEPRADARAAAAATQPPVEHYGAPIAATPALPARGNAVTNINDLAPNVRSQLPRLAVGGAIYSESPSARMVILNGQVFHEGDKPAADTVLEQIRLKSAILNFRGQRYEVSF
jgi:general secretion pathway protein B